MCSNGEVAIIVRNKIFAIRVEEASRYVSKVSVSVPFFELALVALHCEFSLCRFIVCASGEFVAVLFSRLCQPYGTVRAFRGECTSG